MKENYTHLFGPMEIDAIGEIMNISLGSSATAVSTLLDRRVDITTPTVDILVRSEFEFSALEPAIGIQITYTEGLEGNNIMLMKEQDIRTILGILMQTEIPEEDFLMDEIAISAVCEVMNQMMGASATAMSEFLGARVDISTPVTIPVTDVESFKDEYFVDDQPMIVISFRFYIEGCMDSTFMTVMSLSLGKRIISASGSLPPEMMAGGEGVAPETPVQAPAPAASASDSSSSEVMSDDAIAALFAAQESPAAEPTPAAPPASDSSSSEVMSDDAIAALFAAQETPATAPQPTPAPQPQAPPQTTAPQVPPEAPQPMPQQAQVPPQMPLQQPYIDPMQAQYMQQPYMQPQYMAPPMQQTPPPQPQPKIVHVAHQESPERIKLSEDEESNLNMIMTVPLEISAEIGRTKKTVKEIIDFAQGTLIVLDKLAGDQVDIFVNGQKIAKGDVVVIDDSFGVKITEIIDTIDLNQNS